MPHKLTKTKVKKILKDGKVRGKALTAKQKKFFGAIAGGQKPYKEGMHKMPDGRMMKDSEMNKKLAKAMPKGRYH